MTFKFLWFIFLYGLFLTDILQAGQQSSQKTPVDFQLNILHINDHHSHIKANSYASLYLNEKKTYVEIGGFPRIVSKFKKLESKHKNIVKIHAGDAITGTIFYNLFQGQSDAAFMNQVCFDIFAVGNHEFDYGDKGLKTFLDYLQSEQCQTAVLGANIVPQLGTPLAPEHYADYIVPYVIKNIENQKVAFIGINIKGKTKLSSQPLKTTLFLDELDTAQKYINELRSKGINKIILVTHYQYQNDIKLAQQLHGVDVIVGGDSHTLLGEFLTFGFNSAGPYPTITKNIDGHTVCVIHAWQYSQIVGELLVQFDKQGNVLACSGTPHLLLGTEFKKVDKNGQKVTLNDAELNEVLVTIEQTPHLSVVLPDPGTQRLLEFYDEKVKQLSKTTVAEVNETLCMERIPGQGVSEICSDEQTSMYGGDIQQLVSTSMRERIKTADVALLNAGAIRHDLEQGTLNLETVYRLMPFSNTLVEFQITGEQIKTLLEQALDYALNPNFSSGAFPYASGLQWQIDANKSRGERFSNLRIKPKGSVQWQALQRNRSYILVTNSYLASGRDGYELLGQLANQGYSEDTFVNDAQAFIDYVKYDLNGVLKKLSHSQYSTQKFNIEP